MELKSFEKLYVALLNSANWATGGPLWYLLRHHTTYNIGPPGAQFDEFSKAT